MINSEVAGFAIVQELNTGAYDMEQFFVLRKFRRKGVGRSAAKRLFDEFSGQWTVEQIATNKAAQIFWRGVISDYTNGNFQDTINNGAPIQRFVS